MRAVRNTRQIIYSVHLKQDFQYQARYPLIFTVIAITVRGENHAIIYSWKNIILPVENDKKVRTANLVEWVYPS